MWERVKSLNPGELPIPLLFYIRLYFGLTFNLHFQMKLCTHVPRNNVHVYTKSHNSGINYNSEMPLFRLRKNTQALVSHQEYHEYYFETEM